MYVYVYVYISSITGVYSKYLNVNIEICIYICTHKYRYALTCIHICTYTHIQIGPNSRKTSGY
jgi:hypothetical protein